MSPEKIKNRTVWIIASLGIIVSLLSLLEFRLAWLADLCGIFGSGCSQAADYTLFKIPIAVWGMFYYLALAVLARFRFMRGWLFRLVMLGIGAEITFVWLLISRNISCVFCILNAVVIAVLLILFIHRRQFWQCTALILIGLLLSNYLIVRENPAPVASQPVISGDSTVIELNGHAITLTELESGIATKLYKMRQEIYRLKLQHLEALIERSLIKQQSGRRNIDDGSSSFLEDQSRDPIRREAQRIIQEAIQTQPDIDQYLEKPALPFTRISIGDSPVKGASDAAVTVIEFSDYLCPACKWAHPISKEIIKYYGDKIMWVFKDYPLTRHEGADKLAEAARCAGQQNRFWEFQDLLFEAKEHPGEEELQRFGRELNLDMDQFNQCIETEKYAESVMRDKADATTAGVNSTPSFIINGRLHPGSMPLDTFKKTIDEALGQRNP